MTNDIALERLRAANPAAVSAEPPNDALFAAIVASPTNRPQAAGRRALVAAVAGCALVVGVATAWAASESVRDLFATNPAGGGGRGEAPTGLWRQDAIPSTIRRAGVLTLPHAGMVELWTAATRQGGWCGAVRLPDGGWAGTGGTDGGTAPGCYPSRRQTNEAAGKPVYVITGFDYYDVALDARDAGGQFWRIVYGVTELERPVARVLDTVSGRNAAVQSGRFFALAVPDAHPDVPSATPLWHLVAYDASGKRVADANEPLATR